MLLFSIMGQTTNCNVHRVAAVKLQKVYKSFRTRRKLSDCTVLVEQSWWKLHHHETPLSRWSRAKIRAAKVGKGLSLDSKAQKLALQHWLEIDPRHRTFTTLNGSTLRADNPYFTGLINPTEQKDMTPATGYSFLSKM